MKQKSKSIYSIFWDWVFDKDMRTELPEAKVILKYNSPIHSMFLLKSFMNIPSLNMYLNEYMNSINIMSIDKFELFKFIKKCVIDFKVKRKDILFIHYDKKNELFDKLRSKNAFLKGNDLELLIELINKSPNIEDIYESLGIAKKPVQKKLKTKKASQKIKLEEFLANFLISEVKE